jgi:hypothetical protein
MKQLLAIMLTLALVLALVACSSDATAPQESDGNNTSASVPTVLDLTGGWKQVNSNSDESYQIAMIADGTIEIYWSGDDDTTALYWAGTYIVPSSETNDYSWNSVNDKSRTAMALLASGDDTKTFTHKDGVISYSVSAMGVTTTVELKRSDDVNIQVQKAVSPEDLLPLELVDYGYAVKDSADKYYIQYAFMVKNPNTERAVEFPKVRLTARDADGAILGTEDIVGWSILPGRILCKASQGPSVDSKPATVDFEVIEPDDTDWVSPDRIDNAGEPLTIENPIKREEKIVGEIFNPNDFDVSSVVVVVLFRDDSGKLLAGETTYADKISAGGTIPFELSLWSTDDGYVTDNFEVYAYPW